LTKPTISNPTNSNLTKPTISNPTNSNLTKPKNISFPGKSNTPAEPQKPVFNTK
jgi:hypothetical protein